MRKTAFILFSAILTFVIFSGANAAAELVPGQGLGSIVVNEDGAGELDLAKIGKPYVLAFFVPGGEKDKKQLQELQKILKKKELAGVEFFAITRGMDKEEQDKARDFLKSTGVKSKLLFEGKMLPAARRFETRHFPTFQVIDEKGVFRMTSRSVTDKPRRLSFEDALARILAGKDIPLIDLLPVSPNTEKGRELIGKPAPDFSLVDLNEKVRALSSYKGRKNIILVFWSPKCPHCLRELPMIQQYYMSRRFDFDFEVLAIAGVQDESMKKTLDDVVSRNMFTFPVMMDKDGAVINNYKVGGVPCVYFIDKKGVIQELLVGETKQITETYNSIFYDTQRLGEAKKSD